MRTIIWYVLQGTETKKYNTVINDRFIIEIITVNPKDKDIDKESLFFGRRCATLYLDAELASTDKYFVRDHVIPCCQMWGHELIMI